MDINRHSVWDRKRSKRTETERSLVLPMMHIMGYPKILFMLACNGEDSSKLLSGSTIARALSVNWAEYDMPDQFKWYNHE